jgi:hypothetical protein
VTDFFDKSLLLIFDFQRFFHFDQTIPFDREALRVDPPYPHTPVWRMASGNATFKLQQLSSSGTHR